MGLPRQGLWMANRVLLWAGCTNVRDLGGLRTGDGRLTRWGAIVRSDSPARLTAAGWSALYAYGIRTIITLCTDGLVESELNFTPPQPNLVTVQIAIEDVTDKDFVQQWASTDLWCTLNSSWIEAARGSCCCRWAENC